MSHQAKITCDLPTCSKVELFAPEQRPPRSWYLVTHPMQVPCRQPGKLVHTEQRLSTFCSAPHLAAWAADAAEMPHA